MLEGQVIALSIKDYFTKPMLKIALLPLAFAMFVMFFLFFTAADFGFDALKEFINASQNGEEVIVDPSAPFYFVWATYLIAFLFQYSITSWLVGFLFYTVGTIFVMMFSVFLTILIIGFLTPVILDVLQKRHYSHIQTNGFGNILSPLWVMLKAGLIMIGLFILFIPLYFIPLVNIFAINLPFYYFFHKLLTFDVASTILTNEEYKVIHDKKATAFRARTLLLYFVSIIPFITLFSAVFYIIYLGHSYFIQLEKIRSLDLNLKEEDKQPKLLEND